MGKRFRGQWTTLNIFGQIAMLNAKETSIDLQTYKHSQGSLKPTPLRRLFFSIPVSFSVYGLNISDPQQHNKCSSRSCHHDLTDYLRSKLYPLSS